MTVNDLSPKARAIYNLYNKGKISRAGVRKAYTDGTITIEEYIFIVGDEE